jgi:DNA repair protein RadB
MASYEESEQSLPGRATDRNDREKNIRQNAGQNAGHGVSHSVDASIGASSSSSLSQKKIDAGASCINELLDGGYESDVITTIYGPAGSGKSNLCLLALIGVVRSGKKVIYIDTESSFSLERLKQLVQGSEGMRDVLKHVVLLKLGSFREQKDAFEKLKRIVNSSVGLIIVDSIAMLYRLEIGKTQEVYDVNRALGLQLSLLSEITRKKGIPVLLTNQVYSSFDGTDSVRLVGGDILKYSRLLTVSSTLLCRIQKQILIESLVWQTRK